MLEHALDLVARYRWHVFPVWWPHEGRCACGDPDCTAPAKHPVQWLVSRGKTDATTDIATIQSWWARAPQANIGISTAPSNLLILDVDVSGKKQGMASLATIYDQLPETLQVTTGSGGIHAYYARNDIEPFQRIGALPGIDLIGNGYVIAPPSLHASGQQYSWANKANIATVPPVLINLHRERASVTEVESRATIGQGDRNNALFRLGAAIRGTNVGRNAVRAALHMENAARFNPPCDDAEIDAVVASVMTRVHPERDAALSAVIERGMQELYPTFTPVAGSALAHELIGEMMRESKLPIVHLPFTQLDSKLGGLAQHSMTMIVAGTGKGKSSLALQLAAYHAEKHGPAIYYVGEMTRTHVLARAVGQLLGKSWLEVLRGGVAESEVRRVLGLLPIYFVKRSDNPIVAIVEACKRALSDGHAGMPMVIVDYVQLLAAVSKEMRISTMQAVRDLQVFAETAPVTLVVLSQTSRGGAARIRKGSDDAEELGDTGAETAELERSATNQLVLSFMSKDDVEVHEVTMMITKSRFGGGSKLGFSFNGKTGLWTPLAKAPVSQDHEERCKHQLTCQEIPPFFCILGSTRKNETKVREW